MRRANTAILTVGGLGLSPVAPGSLGAIPAIPAGWALRNQGWPIWLAILLPATALSVVLANLYLRQVGDSPRHRRTKAAFDPQEIVLDEFLGCLIALAFVPWSWPWVAAAYGLFRLLDMFKPGPIRWIDEKAPKGLGIMGDDVAAGLVAGLMLLAAVHLQASL